MSPRATKDRGAVLLTTLLVMSLMATVAVSIMDDVRFALKRTANVQAYAQADWYVSGAEAYAQNYLENLLTKTDTTALNTGLLQGQPIILPLEGGTINLSIRDGSQCMSLSDLRENDGRRLFRQLLETLGWSSLSAANFTSVATDWIDEDTQALPGGAEDYAYLGKTPAYRTPNTAFASTGELRALSGLKTEDYAELRPYVCARENSPTYINIDTLSPLQAPLLAALLGGVDNIGTAQSLITERPAQGYQNLQILNASNALADQTLSGSESAKIVFEPRYIWIEMQVNYQNITRYAVMEFAVEDKKLTRIFKRLGADERRLPMIEDPS
jgi:general secretion pathway protein K